MMPRPCPTFGLLAIALAVVVLFAARPAAADDPGRRTPADRLTGDIADPMVPATPPEAALRRRWLVYTLLDDARDALRDGRTNSALALLRWAEGSLATLRPTDSRLQTQLATVREQIEASDEPGAARTLDAAASTLHSALMAREDQLHPIVAQRTGRGSPGSGDYGSSGAANRPTGSGGMPGGFSASPGPSPQQAPTSGPN